MGFYPPLGALARSDLQLARSSRHKFSKVILSEQDTTIKLGPFLNSPRNADSTRPRVTQPKESSNLFVYREN